MDGERDTLGCSSSARRRRERRLQAFHRHEQVSIRMVVAAMSHHSWDNSKSGASAPAVTYADACTQTVAPAPGVPVAESTTLAPVNEYIAPALMSPQSSGTAVEVSAPQAVVSVPPSEVFTEPVYNQIHQEQLVTGEMTLSIVEHPAVQEQATFQEIPRYVAPAPVIENIAPAPAVTSDAHSQQLPPVYTRQQSLLATTLT